MIVNEREFIMNKYWFKRFAKFAYIPTNWYGIITILIMSFSFLTLSYISFVMRETNPIMSGLFLVLAFAAGIFGHVVVFKRMEE